MGIQGVETASVQHRTEINSELKPPDEETYLVQAQEGAGWQLCWKVGVLYWGRGPTALTLTVLKLPASAQPRAVCETAPGVCALTFPSGSLSACSSCHKTPLAGILTHEVF